jgi:hypothetical protein
MEIREISQTFVANVASEIALGGRYFRVVSSVNPFTLEVGFNGRYVAKMAAAAGRAGRVRDGEEPFTHLRITTTGNEAVVIEVSDGDIWNDAQSADVSDRAGRLLGVVYGSLGVQLLQILSNGLNLLGTLIHGTLGQIAQVAVNAANYLRVQVQGHGDAETDAGKAFIMVGGITAVAAQYSEVQVKNVAASGKTFYLDKALVHSNGAADQIAHGPYNTDLTTDVGAMVNKDAGGAASSTRLRKQNNAAQVGSIVSAKRIETTTGNAEFVFDPPIKLEAGEGYVFNGGVVNQALTVTIEGREY